MEKDHSIKDYVPRSMPHSQPFWSSEGHVGFNRSNEPPKYMLFTLCSWTPEEERGSVNKNKIKLLTLFWLASDWTIRFFSGLEYEQSTWCDASSWGRPATVRKETGNMRADWWGHQSKSRSTKKHTDRVERELLKVNVSSDVSSLKRKEFCREPPISGWDAGMLN